MYILTHGIIILPMSSQCLWGCDTM